MGLASSLSTALTGLSAAETTIDVVGNNLANSNTIGFKESAVNFATQFLQTLSLGSAPNDNTGGTNPRQTGLGTMVAEVTPDFSQGTVEISSNPMDMAIQGEGFFMVQGQSNETMYTRNGVFKLNSQNEVVAITGQRLLGFGVDDRYQIQQTVLEPIVIPLGQAAVAQATENVYLEGTLSPVGDLATTAEIVQTGVLGDRTYLSPDTSGVTMGTSPQPGAPTLTPGAGGLMTEDSTYRYRVVFWDSVTGTEGTPSGDLVINLAVGEDQVTLTNIPTDATGIYDSVRLYRSAADGSSPYYEIDSWANGAVPPTPPGYPDGAADAAILGNPQLNTTLLNYSYNYYITYVDAAGVESAPQAQPLSTPIGAGTRIQLRDLPVAPPGSHPGSGWVGWRIYRNVSTDESKFYRVAQVGDALNPLAATAGITYTDSMSDTVLATQPELDFNGARITNATLLTDIQRYENGSYYQVVQEGELAFTGRKGGRSLATKNMTVGSATTVQDLITFMEQSFGIQKPPGPDPLNPIPPSATPTGTVNPGGSVVGGKIQFVGNNGVDNAVEVSLSGLQLIPTGSTAPRNINLPFASSQSAIGASAVTDFIAYDSLGIPLRVRVTAVLESRDSAATTYRWFADSSDNDPTTGVQIAVGTGLVTFDGEGKFIAATNSTAAIDRAHLASTSPLAFQFDFSKISGLAADKSALAASRQDGSGPGVLTSFIVGENGRISGVFSNGVTRDLAQVRLARFANPNGLEQRGQNMFVAGVNSGLPVQGNPGEQGIGTIVGGATELSNTDIGGNLIDLILASTMYRSNTRVITTVQQMFDELLALRR
jgi:flagellar hook protein FlgE